MSHWRFIAAVFLTSESGPCLGTGSTGGTTGFVKVLCYSSVNLGLKTEEECRKEQCLVAFNSVKSGQRIQTSPRLDFFGAHGRPPFHGDQYPLQPCVHPTVCEIYAAFFPPKCRRWRSLKLLQRFPLVAYLSGGALSLRWSPQCPRCLARN